MSRKQSLPDLIRYEAKRRPEIAALIERAVDLTDDEIAAAAVPLPWYRNALKVIRAEEQQKRELGRTDLDDLMVFGINKDPVGKLCRYDGMDEFMDVDCASGLMTRSMLQVKTGALVWFPMTGGVWIDTVFSAHVDHRLNQSTQIKYVTRSQYQDALRDARAKIHGLPQEVDADDRGLFRIQRH